MKNMELRALLDLLMVSDPWPLDNQAQRHLVDFADRESQRRGFENWTVAYHEFDATTPDDEAAPMSKHLEAIKRLEEAGYRHFVVIGVKPSGSGGTEVNFAYPKDFLPQEVTRTLAQVSLSIMQAAGRG